VEYSGSAYCALYLYKYCYKGSARKERIDLGSEQEHDSLDEIKLFIYGRILCSMVAVWKMYGYQDYPAPEPPVCAFKVCSGAQSNDFIQQCEVTLITSTNDCYSFCIQYIEHVPSQYTCIKMNYLMVYDVVGGVGRICGLHWI
jgi:hypothetical protein